MLAPLYVATEKDRKEAQARERRKQIEQERKDRIFNVKFRKIGIDIATLERQKEERKLLKEYEGKIQKEFDDQMDKECSLAYQLSEKEKAERRRINSEINEFRKRYQRKEDRREFDLNDPNGLRKQLPPRCKGTEEVSISSAQKFEGEDLLAAERAKVMNDQKMAWLQQQIKEQKANEEELKAADEAYRKITTARDERALQLEAIERECRQRLDAANAYFNKALAQERRSKEAMEAEYETQDNKAEIFNNLTSGMLAETHDVADSAFGPARIIGAQYKGMTQAEKNRIRKTQMEQIEQNKKKRDAERQLENQWDDMSNSILKSVYNRSCEEQQRMRKNAIRILQENMELSKEQHERKRYANRVLNTNQPTDDFYRQFNTTTR